VVEDAMMHQKKNGHDASMKLAGAVVNYAMEFTSKHVIEER
jgi:hypothetical protein